MASIKRRPDGRWRARYRDDAGKEHARHFTRKVDAQRWLDETTAALVTGAYADPKAGRTTFREFAEQWRSTAVHRPSTRARAESLLRIHVYPVLGDRPIGSIRASAVQAFVSGAAGTLAPATLRMAYSVVAAIFTAAVRDKVISASPCEGVRLPEARQRKIQPPKLAVLDTLTVGLPDRLRAVVALVEGSGLRQGEVFGLEVEHVDFLRGRHVQVEQQLVSPSTGAPYLGPPKTPEAERLIPLAQVTLDVLAAHLAAWPAVEVEIEDRTDPRKPHRRTARLLFTLDSGRPIARNAWSDVWMPAARAAGLPTRTGLHVVRHWYASALIRHGASVKAVQSRLGHASASVTLDVYSHLWPDDDDTTRAAVEAALAAADSLRTEETS